MGYVCRKSGGGGEDIACYMKDVMQTRNDLKSDDIVVRAEALIKQRKAAQVAKKIPQVLSLFRKGLQGTLATLGGPAGAVVEGLVEAVTYDYFRARGYDHKQASSETFFAKMFGLGDLKEDEGRGLFEDATKLIKKETAGKDPAKLRYLSNLEKLDELSNELGTISKALEGDQYLKPGQKELFKKQKEDKAQEILDLQKKVKPGSPDYEAWKEGEERQQIKADLRAKDFKSENRVKPTFDIDAPRRLQEQRKYLTGLKPGEKGFTYEETKPSILNYEPGEIDEFYTSFGLEPEDASRIKWETVFGTGYDLLDKIGAAGGVSKMASGGLASLTRTIPPKKGPNSQGLAYLKKYVS
jgi:DNA-binding phage protein